MDGGKTRGMAAARLGGALVTATTGTAILAMPILDARPARATTPTVVWQTTTTGTGVFSGDGSSVLLNTATGFADGGDDPQKEINLVPGAIDDARGELAFC